MKLSARLLVCGLFLSFLLFFITVFTPKETFAQQYYSPNFESNVPQTTHNLAQGLLIDITSAITCQLAGVDPVNPDGKCLGVNPKNGKIGFIEQGNGGTVGVLSNMIGLLYTPPIHSTDYFSYMAGNFGFSKKAYADGPCVGGVGFCGIQPISKLWAGFRDIVYILFVLLFVIVGITIMLRIKIDPRTVMTIENQIPKILIGIILVTFSFAIAGFLIDIMYVSIYVVFNIFSGIAPSETKEQIWQATSTFNSVNVMAFFNKLIGFTALTNTVSQTFTDVLKELLDGIPILGELFGLDAFGIKPFEWVTHGIAYIIILFALIYAMVRLFFQLLLAYFGILVDIVTAPFWIMAGSMPGGIGGVGAWFRDITANLLAFPTTVVILLLGKSFMDAFTEAAKDPNKIVFSPPLTGALNAELFGQLVGFGTILIAPKALDYMRTGLKAPKFDFAPIVRSLGAGGSAVRGSGKEMLGSATTFLWGDPYAPEGGPKSLFRRWQRKGG